MTVMESDFDVGRRLASLRLLRDRSQRSVAERAGLAPSYLSRIETGRVQPTFPTVLRILRSIGSDVSELLEPQRMSVRDRGACPVSPGGRCFLDSIRPEVAGAGSGEFYTAREVRLIRRFGCWLKSVKPNRIQAMELLLNDWRRGSE